jgi:hypothetical protein
MFPKLEVQYKPPDFNQDCGVGVGVVRNFRWNRSRKEFLGGVGVGKKCTTPTPTSV